jgi:hypothetical protein
MDRCPLTPKANLKKIDLGLFSIPGPPWMSTNSLIATLELAKVSSFVFCCYSSILTCSSTRLVISSEFITCRSDSEPASTAQKHAQGSAIHPTESESSQLRRSNAHVSAQLSLSNAHASSSSSKSPSHLVSELEAMSYYSGVSPTPPKLVYRTGSLKTPCVKPKGLELYHKKQAHGVFNHKLNKIWKVVGPQVRDLLNAQRVP